MPYDPRQMLQLGQLGLGMMSPAQGNPFAQVQRPKQWWEQPLPAGRSAQTDQPQQDDPPNPNAKPPPSLLDMLMSLNRLRSPSDRAPADRAPASQASPWGWLGSMGMPGGAGWGGGGVR